MNPNFTGVGTYGKCPIQTSRSNSTQKNSMVTDPWRWSFDFIFNVRTASSEREGKWLWATFILLYAINNTSSVTISCDLKINIITCKVAALNIQSPVCWSICIILMRAARAPGTFPFQWRFSNRKLLPLKCLPSYLRLQLLPQRLRFQLYQTLSCWYCTPQLPIHFLLPILPVLWLMSCWRP